MTKDWRARATPRIRIIHYGHAMNRLYMPQSVLFLLFVVVLLTGCTQRPGKNSSDTQDAKTASVQRSRWAKQHFTANGQNYDFEMQFPETYTPLNSFPLVFFYPGTAVESLQTRTALLVNAQAIPPAVPGWPEDTMAEDILHYVFNNLNTENSRRFLAIPLSRQALAFASRNAWYFDGLLIQCPSNAPLPDIDTELMKNLAGMPVYIDNGTNPEPPQTSRLLQTLLLSCQAGKIRAPEFMISQPQSNRLEQAVDFLTENARTPQANAFKWHARQLKYGQAYWLRMDTIADYSRAAAAEARLISDGTRGEILHLSVVPDNLKAFSIWRNCPLFRPDAPLHLEIGFQAMALPKVPLSQYEIWTCIELDETTGRWSAHSREFSVHRKTPLCEGPISSFLRHPFVIVTSSRDETTAELWEKAAADFAEQYSKKFGLAPALVRDTEFQPSDAQEKNILLFGGPEKNLLSSTLFDDNASFLRDIYSALPEGWRDDDKLGCLTLHPAGILAPGHLALLVLGNSDGTISKLLNPLLEPDNLDICDYMLFNAVTGEQLVKGMLNADWTLKR